MGIKQKQTDPFLQFVQDYAAHASTPDNTYDRDSITFIYTKDGQFFAKEYPETHLDLIHANPQAILGASKPEKWAGGLDGYHGATSRGLLGRISAKGEMKKEFMSSWEYWCDQRDMPHRGFPFDGRTITFWNYEDSAFSNLDDCISLLLKKQLIEPTDLIMTSNIIKYVNRFSDSKAASRVGTASLHDTKQKDLAARIALAKNLHLMKAGEKKNAMAQLGLVQGSVKNPWHSEMERQGLVKAGQKWWAPQSENLSFRQWLVAEGRGEK